METGPELRNLGSDIYRLSGEGFTAIIHTARGAIDYIPSQGSNITIKLTEEGLQGLVITDGKISYSPLQGQALEALSQVTATLQGLDGTLANGMKAMLEQIVKSQQTPPK